jgi:hypothetical protein
MDKRNGNPIRAATQFLTSRERLPWSRLFVLVALFLGVFGLMNFAELPLGWKDRVPQISHFLAVTVHLGPQWAKQVLWLTKTSEGLLGLLAIVGLVRRDVRWLLASIAGWMVMMIGYSFMDVWAADRAELLEHSSYFAAFAMMLTVVIVVVTAAKAKEWLRRPEFIQRNGNTTDEAERALQAAGRR